MEEAIIAKLAFKCEECYAKACENMKSSTNTWKHDWIPKVTAKQSACRGIAQYYLSRVCNGEKAVGEEIAFLHVRRKKHFTLFLFFNHYILMFLLQDAIENFKSAQQRSGDATKYQDYLNKAQRFLAKALKDIYQLRVPEALSLEPVGGKTLLAKVLPMPERLSSNFKGISFIIAIHFHILSPDD